MYRLLVVIVLASLFVEKAMSFSPINLKGFHSSTPQLSSSSSPPRVYSVKFLVDQNKATSSGTALFNALTLYGSQGSRSPLVNWAAYELGIDITMGDLSKNPHPFGQIPCLVDEDKDDVVVFESGAILLYLNSLKGEKGGTNQGEIYSWVCWANASLDPICFLETPEGKVYDTGLKNTNNKRIHRLNQLLENQKFLLGGDDDDDASLTVADVAVASYLLYVVQFFPDIDLSTWPHIVRYMKDCASREEYAKAFGEPVQAYLLDKLEKMGGGKKKILGMF